MLKRSIKFPIVLNNGAQVRTLEELRNNFDIETIIEYYLDGRLRTWLEQRSYTSELQLLDLITEHNDTLPRKICEVFGISYDEQSFNYEGFVKRKRKVEIISQYTTDPDILNNYEKVAISQHELDTICENLKGNDRTVYLLGDVFNINDNVQNIRYIGINKPTLRLLGGNKCFDAKGKNIVFKNVNITSDEERKIKPTSDSSFELDKHKIKKGFNMNKLITTINIDGSKFKYKGSGRYSPTARKIYVGGNTVVVEIENVIAIYDIDTMKVLNSFNIYEFEHCVNTIKADNRVYCLDIEDVNIQGRGWVSQYKLMSVDLNSPTPKTQKIKFAPYVSMNEIRVNLLGVNNNIVYMYSVSQNVNNSDNLEIKSRRIEINTGKMVMDKRIEESNTSYRRNSVPYCFSDGGLYYFIPTKRILRELHTDKTIMQLNGTIGEFVIKNDKVFATRSKPNSDFDIEKEYKNTTYKASKYSLVDLGELVVIDVKTGNEIKRMRAHDGEIDVLKVCDNVLLTCSKWQGEVKLWDMETLELLNVVNIPIENYWTTPSFDVDFCEDQIAVLIENKVFIYR